MSVQLVNVTKSYVTRGQRHTVLRRLSLDIPSGLNVGVIGPNGSGKSTLLKLIAGAELPDSGTVRRRARISWPVGFSGALNPGLTGTANARFCARLYGRDPNEVVRFTREFSALDDFMDWPVKTYSKGMRSRLAFAVSMAIDFECLLIDEVMSVGDADFRAKCVSALNERRARSSLILVTHNLKEVRRLCDRVVILGGGEPIISDDVTETIKFYAAMFGDAGPEDTDE